MAPVFVPVSPGQAKNFPDFFPWVQNKKNRIQFCCREFETKKMAPIFVPVSPGQAKNFPDFFPWTQNKKNRIQFCSREFKTKKMAPIFLVLNSREIDSISEQPVLAVFIRLSEWFQFGLIPQQRNRAG